MKKLHLAGVMGILILLMNSPKINPVSFLSPVVITAPALTVMLPVASIALTGQTTNPGNGHHMDFIWSQVAGPNTASIGNPDNSSTSISGLRAGTYVFELFATDSKGATGTAFDTVFVQAPWTTLTSSDLSAIY